MSTEILKEEVLTYYQDDFHFLDHCKRNPTQYAQPASGNGKLYHSQAYILLKRLGETVIDIPISNVMIKDRHPLLPRVLEQHDNIMGVMALDYIANPYPAFAKHIYHFCRQNKKWGIFYTYDNLNTNTKEWNTVILPHNAFIINFCAEKYWGIINTICFIGMLLITPYKKHESGNINAGVRLMGWTMLQPLVKRFKFMTRVEKWYWNKADIRTCANHYYNNTPWEDLYFLMGDKINE